MAPPISRRSKQNSTPSPPPLIPLPGIAVGLFAAIAAGFAASRALRRKRPAQKLQDEPQSVSAGTPPFKEREVEIEERDEGAILIDANGTITIAQEPSKLAAGNLKPVFDAIEEATLVQTSDAKPSEDRKGEHEQENLQEGEDCGNSQIEEGKNEGDVEEHDKKGRTVENGKIEEADDETAEIIVKIEASLAVDDASVDDLQSSTLEENEIEEEEDDETDADGKGIDVKDNGVIGNEDICNDGDHEAGSADQQSSPVLINGRILDFLEEMPDFKYESDLLSSGSTSLSDAVSESSMQEVSSAPVKPFVPTEETLETSWQSGAKPDFLDALNQAGQENVLPHNEKHFCPSENFGSPEIEKDVPEFVENLLQEDQHLTDLKLNWAILKEDIPHLKPFEQYEDVGLVNLKPVLVELENASSIETVNPITSNLLSDLMGGKGSSIAFEGKFSINVNRLEEGVVESIIMNGKVLSTGPSLPEELDDLESIGECEAALQSATRDIADNFTGLHCKNENGVEPARVNGKMLLVESPTSPTLSTGSNTDETSSQTGQKGTDGIASDIHGEHDLLAGIELSGDKTCVSTEDDLYDGECAEEIRACLGCDGSEEHVTVEGILEEPKLQPAPQKLDNVDDTGAENVKLEHEQSSLFIASKEIPEGTELSCEGSADNADREDINDGLSREILVKDTIHIKPQETEEKTRFSNANGQVCEIKELPYLTDSGHVTHNNTRELDHLLSTGAVHQYGLQSKGVSASKALMYLPLEIGVVCFLIALVSYVLWYLEVLPSIHS